MSSSDRRPAARGGLAPEGPEATARATSSPYARFIPREELQDFAAWRPAALGEPAAAPAPDPAEPPPRTVEDVRAEIEASLKAARQAGYEQGHRDGLAALEAAKRSHVQQVSAQVDRVVAALQMGLSAVEQTLSEGVADTALALARQVVRHELATSPALVSQVAQEAVAAMVASARQLRLHLHPDDLALVREGAGEALAARGVALQADASLQRGGCVVHSDLGTVDARIEARWAQAVAVFGQEVPWSATA